MTWQYAYARQAKADSSAYEVLRDSPHLPPCQSLHFLQMAREKLCQAYLCSRKVDPRFLQTSHGLVADNLPVKNLSGGIELLAPTVGSQRRPANCEYPWADEAGNVVVPAGHAFATLSLLSEQAGQELREIIPLAIDELL